MKGQAALFEGQDIATADNRPIVRQADYDKAAAQKPRFGMTSQEIAVLRRAANGKAVLARRASLQATQQDRAMNKRMGKAPILKGQTIACAIAAEHVTDGFTVISRSGLKAWKGSCYYYCLSINETHESFWWKIDDLYDGLMCADTEEDGILVWLLGADEYHRPVSVPLGWPWGKSPVDNWPTDYMDLPGRVCLTDGVVVRPGWHAWGNLHPSGGEAGEHNYVK